MLTTTRTKGMITGFIGLAFFGLTLLVTSLPSEAQGVIEPEISAAAQANQVNLTGGMMAQMAFDTLEGKSTEMIPIELFNLLRSARAFEHEQNFRLAMSLIAAETGMPMMEILPPAFRATSAGSTAGRTAVYSGWGGFAEYGIWSILAFLYVGYLFGRNAFGVKYPEEVQETSWVYQKAA